MVFVPPLAPIVTLAFLGAGFLVLAGSAAALFGLLSKRRPLALGGGILAAGVLAAYGVVWTGASLLAPERVLAKGERKYFCEIDCHLAYSVEGIERAAAIGPERLRPVNGEFVIVTLKTWFDPNTISPRRPLDATLAPNRRDIHVEDAAGRRYDPRAEVADALVRTGRASTPITEPLVPGQSYETLFVFDVPAEARALRLYVGNVSSDGAFLIGHEASPLSKKSWFALE